ncbi:MAG: EAL domain-containing protein [Solirubrobacteraceae bacterium]
MSVQFTAAAGVEAWALHETVQTSTPFGLGLIDLEWRFVRVNAALAAMNGVAAGDHQGAYFGDVVPALWSQIEPALAELLESGDGALTREFTGTNPTATRQTGTWRYTFYPVGDGARLVGIGVLVVELTEQRHADELRSAILQTMADGLLALDHEGRLRCMNAAAERMLGWPEDALRGRSLHDMIHYRRLDGGALSEQESALTRVRTDRRAVRSREDAFVCRDGRMLPILYSATPEPAGGVVIVFRDATDEIERRRRAERELDAVTWVARIREALHDDRLELYSQPIIPLTGGAAREELLLRMITREGEVVSAGSFLSIAEQYGLMVELDRWVIARAVRFAALGRIVQVNLSAASMADTRVLDLIEHELRSAAAPAGNLIFELTETALQGNAASAEAFAAGLRELGCGLALDDFGSGFGNFAYLRRLPVQSLKIDMDFVRDLPGNVANQHLVQAIVSLAQGVEIETIAVGVEDQETLALLRGYGVDYAQGYYISRPTPPRAA